MTTRDLRRVDGDIRFAQGDVRDIHAAMTDAADGRDLWVVGGAPLLPRRLDPNWRSTRHFACARYSVVSPFG